ncbi:MAG: hypothetical protein QXV35_06460, partial [Archaeoglobaceae archaeon]
SAPSEDRCSTQFNSACERVTKMRIDLMYSTIDVNLRPSGLDGNLCSECGTRITELSKNGAQGFHLLS